MKDFVKRNWLKLIFAAISTAIIFVIIFIIIPPVKIQVSMWGEDLRHASAMMDDATLAVYREAYANHLTSFIFLILNIALLFAFNLYIWLKHPPQPLTPEQKQAIAAEQEQRKAEKKAAEVAKLEEKLKNIKGE